MPEKATWRHKIDARVEKIYFSFDRGIKAPTSFKATSTMFQILSHSRKAAVFFLMISSKPLKPTEERSFTLVPIIFFFGERVSPAKLNLF